MAARGETQANVEVSTLVVPAWQLRWRAPELALVLGERALALASARHDEADRLRASALVVFAGNRVGRGVRVADRAIDALKAAEKAGEHETAWLLRVELAACARSVGAPLTGFAAVTPVLEASEVPAELRASALVQASECLVTVGRGDEPTRALAEADQLYVADTTLDDDTRLMLRGLIRAVQAAQHRRWGDIAAAISAAREGLDLLSRFTDPSADSGQGLGRLTLELVLALMDANRLLDASEVGIPMLDRPVRAPSASTSGWLRLALATRVHLPAGRVALAREMLREAAASAERHQLDTLLAESLLALAHVHEVSGELADALTNLRSAHAAERRRARAVYAVRARLAAEFSGVHRQPADLHQQLASLLRPIEGLQKPTDGVLSASLKQQLRQWRPVQVRKGDGLKVNRVRRAAEDMTVEGLSAARQHAAERWRTVQAFGEPDDKTPEPLELPPSPSSDRTVPASGLIASAGAMVSGRRRAARVAAGEIDEDQPATAAESPAPEPTAPEPQVSPASPEQERKRKVEQQLMELQREARRQIEAERQARADQRAQAEREAQAAAEAAREEAARQEAARQEAARKEAARQEAAREEAARQEVARQEVARQEAAREEAARQEAARQEAARHAAERDEAARAEAAARETPRAEPESVLDMLKAQGLRAGGRRRAPDAGGQPKSQSETRSETPSWRVEPPSRLRQDDPQDYFAGTPSDPDRPNYAPDPNTPDTPGSPPRSGLAAAFSRPPAAPDFGPHLDDPDLSYPLHTPASGFPSTPADPDERKLPDLDFSSLDFSKPQQRPTGSVPSPPPAHPDQEPPAEPEPKPLPPLPDPIPPVPTPDEIPQSPEPDLLTSTFLSSADRDDDVSDLPTVPVRIDRPADQPGYEQSGGRPGFGGQSGFGTQSSFGTPPSFGTQSTFGTQTGFGIQSGFGTQSGFGAQPDPATPADSATRPDFTVEQSEASSADPATQADSSSQYDFFSGRPESPAEPAQSDAAHAEPGLTTPADNDAIPTGQAGADGEPGTRTGRPSSRRKPSDLSLADLLAEALVAYETGRRSDEEQFEAKDLAAPEWSDAETAPVPEPTSALERSDAAEQPYLPGRPAEAEHPSNADPLFGGGQSFGSQQQPGETQPGGESAFGAGRSFGVQEPPGEAQPGSDSLFGAGRSFGAQEPSGDAQAGSDSIFGTGRSFGVQEPSGDAQAGSDSLFGAGRAFGAQQSSGDAQTSSDSLFGTGRSFGVQEPPGEAQPGSDSLYGASRSFGAQHSAEEAQPGADSYFGTGQPISTPQPPAETQPSSDPLFRPGQFGLQPRAEAQPSSESYFLPNPAPEPGQHRSSLTPPAESEQEKTGPIVPVGAAPDAETTGPIRPVRPDGPAGWTLPGT